MRLSLSLFIFLSFDGSETLMKNNIIGFAPHRLMDFPPGYSGFPIHPLGCLELEAFLLFQGRIPNKFFVLSVSSHESVFQSFFFS